MPEISFVVLLRIFYSGLLAFVALVLLREVWFVWFERQMTFGEIKYFNDNKVEEDAASRFKYLLSQEYSLTLGDIRDRNYIVQSAESRNFWWLFTRREFTSSESPEFLKRTKDFESFSEKRVSFADLDLNFQGIDFRKLFSSIRTYLSPSVDIKLVLTKRTATNSQTEMYGSVKWPRDGRPLQGRFRRYYDFEIGPQPDDAALARRMSRYLIWLQAFNDERKEYASFDEFCLWVEGLSALRVIADQSQKLSVNPEPDATVLFKTAGAFAPGFHASFDFADTYKVGGSLLSEAVRKDPKFQAQVSIGERSVPTDPVFLASLLKYFHAHLAADRDESDFRRSFFQQAMSEAVADNAETIDPILVGKSLLADRVVPWSEVAKMLAPAADSPVPQPKASETSGGVFESDDIGSFGDPIREVPSILRVKESAGDLESTAFLIAPDVAVTSGRFIPDGCVEYMIAPYNSQEVKTHCVAIQSVVSIGTTLNKVFALKLASPVPDAIPFEFAPRDLTAKSRIGRHIYLLSYLYKGTRKNSADNVLKDEYGRPTYLGGTILQQQSSLTQKLYVSDAYALPGSIGSPVIDAESGKVVAVSIARAEIGGFAMMNISLDAEALSENSRLMALMGKSFFPGP